MSKALKRVQANVTLERVQHAGDAEVAVYWDIYAPAALQLRLLTAMCDGNHQQWQAFMRAQEHSTASQNMMESAIAMLISATHDRESIEKLGFDEAHLLVIIDFLIECVSGGFITNQVSIIHGPLVRSLIRLLETTMLRLGEVVMSVRRAKQLDSASLVRRYGAQAILLDQSEETIKHLSQPQQRTSESEHPLRFVYSAKLLKTRAAQLLVATIEGVTERKHIDALCEATNVSVIKSRLCSNYLLHKTFISLEKDAKICTERRPLSHTTQKSKDDRSVHQYFRGHVCADGCGIFRRLWCWAPATR